MGGLGHVGVQIAAAMGAEVHVLSRTRAKEADGVRFGAVAYHAPSEPGTLKKPRGTFDLMVSTVAGDSDLDRYRACRRVGGAFVDVGLPEHPSTLRLSSLTGGNKVLAGSQIGGIAETQEMLDFCAEHGIVSDVEVIPIQAINEAYERLLKGDVKYRFVIDMASLK